MIIENTQLQSKTLKSLWLSVTLFMWFFYVYLWLPLISLIAWWFGYQTFVFHMVTLDGVTGVKTLLYDYLLFAIILCTSLLIWAKLEKLRFVENTRRSSIKPIKNQSVAKFFELDEAMLTQMQTKKVITVEFNQDGDMTDFHSNH